MIRLTVLYNLQPDIDEVEFLAWRLGDHQEENMAAPGLLRSDFARIEANALDDSPPPYRFMTTADWPDMESFREAFYDPETQQSIQDSMHMLKDPVFLVSEILVSEEV